MLAAIGNAAVSRGDMQGHGDRIESTDGFNKIKIIGNWMLRQHPIDDVRTLFAQNTKPAPGD